MVVSIEKFRRMCSEPGCSWPAIQITVTQPRRNKMQSKIHHYEVLTQYGKEPVASFLEWNDAVAFAGCRDIRLIYK